MTSYNLLILDSSNHRSWLDNPKEVFLVDDTAFFVEQNYEYITLQVFFKT